MTMMTCKKCTKQWIKSQMTYPDEGYCSNHCYTYVVYKKPITHGVKASTDISSFKGKITVLETVKPNSNNGVTHVETGSAYMKRKHKTRKDRMLNFSNYRVKNLVKKLEE